MPCHAINPIYLTPFPFRPLRSSHHPHICSSPFSPQLDHPSCSWRLSFCLPSRLFFESPSSVAPDCELRAQGHVGRSWDLSVAVRLLRATAPELWTPSWNLFHLRGHVLSDDHFLCRQLQSPRLFWIACDRDRGHGLLRPAGGACVKSGHRRHPSPDDERRAHSVCLLH